MAYAGADLCGQKFPLKELVEVADMNKKRLYEMVQGKDTKTLLQELQHLEGRENVKLEP